MPEAAIILIAAFLLDFIIGDPVYRFHPVRLIGTLIQNLEARIYNNFEHKMGGFWLWFFTILTTLIVYGLALLILPNWLVNIFALYSSIALHDLLRHAKSVQEPLEVGNLALARQRVQMIVGRNARLLDGFGVARATIESVAESFVDGFLSPLFWFAAGTLMYGVNGGIAFVLIFKATSTLDSMVGYKNTRYMELGTFSAKADDILNFVPARLSIPIITACSYALKLDYKNAWKTALRDRLQHESPNSAHAEATVAGALNLSLGGPTEYDHGVVAKPWLGTGTSAATAKHIEIACELIRYSAVLAVLITIIFCF